jgi:hypothetical protein
LREQLFVVGAFGVDPPALNQKANGVPVHFDRHYAQPEPAAIPAALLPVGGLLALAGDVGRGGHGSINSLFARSQRREPAMLAHDCLTQRRQLCGVQETAGTSGGDFRINQALFESRDPALATLKRPRNFPPARRGTKTRPVGLILNGSAANRALFNRHYLYS